MAQQFATQGRPFLNDSMSSRTTTRRSFDVTTFKVGGMKFQRRLLPLLAWPLGRSDASCTVCRQARSCSLSKRLFLSSYLHDA